MRAVLDTNVLISALLWRGIPHDCLLAAEAGMYELVLADAILQELQDKLVSKFRSTPDEADGVIGRLRRLATIAAIAGRSGWVPADPDDDMFIEAALGSQADAIVSGDRHLLELGTVAGVRILSPHEFLDRLTSEP
jgi:putative PIN family toxin of toxin-antitoxin system